MVLVDTSVWVSHLREGHTGLEMLLNNAQVMCHPLVIGELACGNIRNRAGFLSLLKNLPQAIQAEHEEVFYFIEKNKLMGKGLGYMDMQLAASAKITGVSIWTLDKRFDEINQELNLSYPDIHGMRG